jgi:ribonuclease D
MLRYAREDTHYLLFIYDVMRKELLDKGLQNSASNP